MAESPDKEKQAEPEWEAAWHSFADYVEETNTILDLSMTAIAGLDGISALKKALRKTDEEVADAKKIEELARHERTRGYPLLVAHSLVSLWSALEAGVARFAPDWLLAHPEALQRP